MTPSGSSYSYAVIYALNISHAAAPLAPVVLDGSGTVYGTVSEGGPNGYGFVFAPLTPKGGRAIRRTRFERSTVAMGRNRDRRCF